MLVLISRTAGIARCCRTGSLLLYCLGFFLFVKEGKTAVSGGGFSYDYLRLSSSAQRQVMPGIIFWLFWMIKQHLISLLRLSSGSMYLRSSVIMFYFLGDCNIMLVGWGRD